VQLLQKRLHSRQRFEPLLVDEFPVEFLLATVQAADLL
jgi:hypothetical protein